jgi:hypothetical protein
MALKDAATAVTPRRASILNHAEAPYAEYAQVHLIPYLDAGQEPTLVLGDRRGGGGG